MKFPAVPLWKERYEKLIDLDTSSSVKWDG